MFTKPLRNVKATVKKVFKYSGLMEVMCPLSLGHFALKSQKALESEWSQAFSVLSLGR